MASPDYAYNLHMNVLPGWVLTEVQTMPVLKPLLRKKLAYLMHVVVLPAPLCPATNTTLLSPLKGTNARFCVSISLVTSDMMHSLSLSALDVSFSHFGLPLSRSCSSATMSSCTSHLIAAVAM